MSVPALGAAWLKVGTQGLGFHIPMSPACPPAMGLWHFCSHSSVPVPIHPRAVPGCSLVLPSTELLGGHGDNAVLLPPVPQPRCSSGFSGEAPPCSGVRDPAQGFPGAFWSCFIDCAKAETEAERRGRRAGGDVWPGRGGMVLCRWELLHFVPWFCTTGRVSFVVVVMKTQPNCSTFPKQSDVFPSGGNF